MNDLISATFLGMKIDTNDPYLRHNLGRLENRFRTRYYSSVQKDIKRRNRGKSSHKRTLFAIDNNKHKFEMVRLIRHLILGEELNLSMSSKKEYSKFEA